MSWPGPRITVVGGGISGLAAAHRVRRTFGPGAQITIVEASRRLGGVLRTVDLAGRAFDVGAEAFVARRPEMPALLAELGLSAQVVTPGDFRPLIRLRGRQVPLPGGTVMGLPASGDGLAGLLTATERDRIDAERSRALDWAPGADPSIGALVADRFGPAVVHALVEPLLGGVYSGPADGIGLRAALPQLAAALDGGAPSLSAAVAAHRPAAGGAPVFGALRGGYRTLIEALIRAAGARVITDTAVTALTRTGRGWRVDPVGETDAVVLAVPAPQAAALLAGPAAGAAAEAARIPVASVALVALAVEGADTLPAASGVLAATTGQDLAAKACTLSSRKWPHLAAAPGGGIDRQAPGLLRLSYGRHGGPEVPGDGDDDALLEVARGDLSRLLGTRPEILDAHVQRWPSGPVQYRPGHAGVVARLRAEVAGLPGLALAGSYLDGVGVPACIGAADAAVERLSRTSNQWLRAEG